MNKHDKLAQGLLYFFIIAGWLGINLFYDWQAEGQDLASGYIGAKVLLADKVDHLYSYDKELFPEQDDALWDQIGQDSQCGMEVLHPYVQIPLWAGLLKPAAHWLNYPNFKHVFHIIILLCLMGSFLLSFRMWVPEFLQPLHLLIFLIVISFTIPFRYTMMLMQTHPILFFFMIWGLYLEHKGKSFRGGLVIAFPIAIKITPIVILFYWMIHKKTRALWGALAGGVILALTSLVLTGWQAHLYFLERISQISSITLTGYANHSVQAYLMRSTMELGSVKNWYMFPTPTWISITGKVITIILFVIFFASVYKSRKRIKQNSDIIISLLIVLQIITAPIAWMHYFFMLFVPITIAFKYIYKEGAIGAWVFWLLTIIAQFSPFAYSKIAYQYANSNQIIPFGLYIGLLLYTYFIAKLWYNSKQTG